MKRVMCVVFVSLMVVPSAQAILRMHGAKPRYWNWAHAAQMNVKLPDATISVFDGGPVYYSTDHEMYVPRAGYLGYSFHDEHGLFLHELGHVYDFANMTRQRRDKFRAIVQTSCRWWADHCFSHRWVSGPDMMVDVPPIEMFAEMYAACALGLTERQYQDQGYLTYGWVPPAGTDGELCELISS